MDREKIKVDIKNVMSTNNMPYVSFCEFDFVKDKLLNCRKKALVPKNARTIIMAIFPYKIENAPPKRISRYAAVPDYHNICERYLKDAAYSLKELFPDNNFEVFVDNSPIPEVAAAAHSGLGVIGKNGLLIRVYYTLFLLRNQEKITKSGKNFLTL